MRNPGVSSDSSKYDNIVRYRRWGCNSLKPRQAAEDGVSDDGLSALRRRDNPSSSRYAADAIIIGGILRDRDCRD